MPAEFDVIVVGSGPAGVSVAFPLLEAGLNVLMVDGGRHATIGPPVGSYLSERAGNTAQWRWMVGADHSALRNMNAVSPKFRVPTLAYTFEGFAAANPVATEGFVAVGSLATGGLSNAWGCGVARLSSAELEAFPAPSGEMDVSYERVTRRIGVSGAQPDDLSDYFGLDPWAQPPIAMDDHHRRLYARYEARRARFAALGFRMGRSRVAVLSVERPGRGACNLSGNCLWGCERRSLYSAADEIGDLKAFASFRHRPGLIVDRIARDDAGVTIHGSDGRSAVSHRAKRLVLAAGTLATTRLALQALESRETVPLQSSPTAAYLLWIPTRLGAARTDAFGLGQLSFCVTLDSGVSAFGSTFSTVGIPVSEFARRLPLGRGRSIDVLRALLSSCVVGNIFLPGDLSANVASLDDKGRLKIVGGHGDAVHGLMGEAAGKLRRAYRHAGAYLLPGSFTEASPGADIHYACTLPMRALPARGQTDAIGGLAGLSGVHVADGACLPTLTEKSHTLTIMANADRIGRALSRLDWSTA